MWFLTRARIEAWVAENMGPEARLRETVAEVASTLERLPRLLDEVEKGASMFSGGRLELHPKTIRALRAPDRRLYLRTMWILILLIGIGLLLIK
jgi:ubiquinone biosynthesis protein